MITPPIFKARFPEFETVDDALIQTLLDESYLLLCDENKYQDTMVLFLTAHKLKIAQKQESGNASPFQTPSAKAVGNVSTSYATISSDNPDDLYYNSTSYGQQYLVYRNALSVGNVRLI